MDSVESVFVLSMVMEFAVLLLYACPRTERTGTEMIHYLGIGAPTIQF